MPKRSFIDAIEVKTPCSENWDEMTGNEKVRFCSHCAESVNNVSEMTRREAMRLVRRSEGRLCVRYRVNPKTKLPMFSPRLTQIARNSGLAAGVLTASMAMSGGVYAQGDPAPSESVRLESTEKPGGTPSKISGYVTDPNGAVIPYAVVSLTNLNTNEYKAVNSSAEGLYEFTDLPPGSYKIKFEAGGFEMREVEHVQLGESGDVRRDAQLGIQQIGEVVQVGGDEKTEWATVGGIGVCSFSSNEKRNALVSAVMNEDVDEVKTLIARGKNVNAHDRAVEGMSPLHAAVETGNLEIMQILLAYGAKPNIRDLQKRTPLMMIDEDAEPELVRILLSYGASTKLVDAERNSALHHYAAFDDPDIIRMLITHGADPNAKNKAGKTPLMVAAENGSIEALRTLIENGANVQTATKKHETAWDLADGAETRALLESFGLVGTARP